MGLSLYFWRYLNKNNLKSINDEISKVTEYKYESSKAQSDISPYEIKSNLDLDGEKYRKDLFKDKNLSDEDKNFYLSKSKILELLKEQKETVINFILSKYNLEKEKLYSDFIRQEKDLLDAYDENAKLKKLAPKEIMFSRNVNALEFTFFYITNKLKSFASLTLLAIFFTILFIFPYMVRINFKFDFFISYSDISFIALLYYGVLTSSFMFFSIFLQIFMIYSVSKDNSKWHNISFIIPNLFLLFLVFLPYIPNIFEELDFILVFSSFMLAYILLLFLWLCYCSSGRLEDKCLAFISVFFFDLIFIISVYFSYNNIHALVYVMLLCLIFMGRSLLFLEYFDYKVATFIAIVFSVVIILLFSYNGVFARVVGIANYQQDMVIKKDFLPDRYKDKNIADCDIERKLFPKFSCVRELKDDIIELKNVLVVGKRDDVYYLKIIEKDYTSDEIFPVHKKNIIN